MFGFLHFYFGIGTNYFRGVLLIYPNLQSLLNKSSSTRSYFLSLPVETQLLLHKHNDDIHSAQELHRYAIWYDDPKYAAFRN